jgi:NADPH:quinone reductase-like Zn-dependent oxidoreductase
MPCRAFATLVTQGFWLTTYISKKSPEEKVQVLKAVIGLIEQKVIDPSGFVGKTFPLAQFKEAVAESTKPARGGKVFLDSRPVPLS